MQNLEEIQMVCKDYMSKEIDLTSNTFCWTDGGILSLSALKKELERLGFEPFGTVYSVTHKRESSIHIDQNDSGWRWSLNIPISNCDGTFITFYDCLGCSTNEVGEQFGKFEKFLKSDCTVAQRIESNKPILIDTSKPHNFETYNEEPRVFLLVRLK